MGFQETFKALSDPVRREILIMLRNGQMPAGEIANQFDMTGATVSYHLSQLKKAGLITENKQTILSIALCLLPIILGIVLWNKLPEEIAVHFNESGTPDNYAPKAFAVFGLPLFMAIIDAIVIFSINKDPKAERHTKFMEQLST